MALKTINYSTTPCATGLLDKIIKDTYKVLMTRGMKGCYVFCTDDELREHIKRIVKTK